MSTRETAIAALTSRLTTSLAARNPAPVVLRGKTVTQCLGGDAYCRASPTSRCRHPAICCVTARAVVGPSRFTGSMAN